MSCRSTRHDEDGQQHEDTTMTCRSTRHDDDGQQHEDTTVTRRSARTQPMTYSSTWQRPILRLSDTPEAEGAIALLRAHDVDFEIRERNAPAVSLEWNAVVYQGMFGVVDFLMFVARLPIPGLRKSERAVDGRPTGFPVETAPLSEARK